MIIAGAFMPGNVAYRETMSASGCCPDMRPTGNAPSRRLSSLLRPHPIRTVRERFLGRRGCSLYIRNAFVSTISFLLDLFLIWLLVEHFAVERYMAVVAGFIVANALHYVLARIWIFRGSERGLVSGYVIFFGNALFGLGVILGGFALLTEVFGVSFLISRVAASLLAGTIVFVLNATVNFRHL
ncbi:MAG: GtrA family protein [Novosphingobium sp.]